MRFERVREIQLCTPIVRAGKYEGSGIVLDERGYVATCAHLLDGTSEGQISLGENEVLNYNFEVAAIGDKKRNVAILKTSPNVAADLRKMGIKLPTFQLSRKNIRNGEIVGLCGYPNVTGPLEVPTVTMGVVAIVRFPKGPIMVGASTYPGNSGGPCFTSDGTIIGIVSGGYDTATLRVPGKTTVAFPSPYSEIFPMSTVSYIAKNKVNLKWKSRP
jgi:S1-C subfamily serine protease